ncbi:hypothetical protein SUDANB6_05430 [Streptomyces sp. enrichment culture]|uniref:PAS domain-containing protein n=1 Tax=Streptomyces sp. enrichment culture TaxID=1795815 RepID=UPI003F569639
MPPPPFADRPSATPPGRGSIEGLVSRARRPEDDVDAVRRGTRHDVSGPRRRRQRALCDPASHRLEVLDEPLLVPPPAEAAFPAPAGPSPGFPPGRAGSAEWNLSTDAAERSGEFHRVLGHAPSAPPLTLDEPPSLVLDEDRPTLTVMIAGCLVDGRAIGGEFRAVRPGGTVRTVHMRGEPVLDADGSTTSMWALLRDVGEPRRGRRLVNGTRDALRHDVRHARPGHRAAAEPQGFAPPRGFLQFPRRGGPGMGIATGYVPSRAGTPDGAWCDALPLAVGETPLGAGGPPWPGTGAAGGTAVVLGALHGMALAGAGPARLPALPGRLLDATAPSAALIGAACCHHRPVTRTRVAWTRPGHPAPLPSRAGTGRRLIAPDPCRDSPRNPSKRVMSWCCTPAGSSRGTASARSSPG